MRRLSQLVVECKTAAGIDANTPLRGLVSSLHLSTLTTLIYFQFAICIIVLVCSFILIPMLCVYGPYKFSTISVRD